MNIKNIILKLTINKLYFLAIGLALNILSSCEVESNPLETAYIDIQQIVINAEKRSESLKWNLDVSNEQFQIENAGLDALFVPAKFTHNTQDINIRDLRYYINQELSAQEKEASYIESYVSHYESQQQTIITLAQELQQSTLDSLKSYKKNLLKRLNDGTITQIQYDDLLTRSKETFIIYLRHKYQESRIINGSSQNLNEVLNHLPTKLSQKSWERLRTRLKQE